MFAHPVRKQVATVILLVYTLHSGSALRAAHDPERLSLMAYQFPKAGSYAAKRITPIVKKMLEDPKRVKTREEQSAYCGNVMRTATVPMSGMCALTRMENGDLAICFYGIKGNFKVVWNFGKEGTKPRPDDAFQYTPAGKHPKHFKFYSPDLINENAAKIYMGAAPNSHLGGLRLRDWLEANGITFYKVRWEEDKSLRRVLKAMRQDGHIRVIVEDFTK